MDTQIITTLQEELQVKNKQIEQQMQVIQNLTGQKPQAA